MEQFSTFVLLYFIHVRSDQTIEEGYSSQDKTSMRLKMAHINDKYKIHVQYCAVSPVQDIVLHHTTWIVEYLQEAVVVIFDFKSPRYEA